MMRENPAARKSGIVMQEMPDEVLIYDLERNKAHCLNETSMMVWKACDGTRTVEEISRVCGAQTGAQVPEEMVWLALDQLSRSNLLEAKMALPSTGTSRREVIKKIGLATVVALPLVASFTAPSSVSAEAASCIGRDCMGDAVCGSACTCMCIDTDENTFCDDQSMTFMCG